MHEYQAKVIEELEKIVQHGYGTLHVEVEEIKNLKIKIVVRAGRSWAYFTNRRIDLTEKTQVL